MAIYINKHEFKYKTENKICVNDDGFLWSSIFTFSRTSKYVRCIKYFHKKKENKDIGCP